MQNWMRICLAALLAGFLNHAQAADPPTPYGPVPSARQLEWHALGFYGFLHFTVNTFTDKEWGYGDEPESVFNPTDFDADQIVRTARDAGMKGLILTCKHHDGFCLWPSKYTEHSVKNSPWRNGRGDVVKEVSDACRHYGLKFGVYLSPWDRNRADYGTPAYITYYRNQLRELLTDYGPIFEVWFDGANGGDGFYGGAREKRTIDRTTYYDWPNTWKIVRELQPNACLFSDAGPDIRWVGNESGRAGVTCWHTLNRADFAPGQADSARLNSGDRPGTDWVPAECDVSIRPGWFYHAAEDARVKTPGQLLDLYFDSIGRGASFLLNLPPDRRGQIATPDQESLRGFRKLLDETFAHDLAKTAAVTASNIRGNDARFAADNVVHGGKGSYWATDDGVTNADLVLEFQRPVTFSVVRLREYLPLGQRVEAFALDQWKNAAWVKFGSGTSIGNCRLLRCDPVTTPKVRLRITRTPVCPAITEVALFDTSTAEPPASRAELAVPAYTAYVVPNPDGATVSPDAGVSDWTDPSQKLLWFGDIKTTGRLDCAMRVHLPAGVNSNLRLTVAGKSREAMATGAAAGLVIADFGSFDMPNGGYQQFTLESRNPAGQSAGDLQTLMLGGPASVGAQFNLKPRRNAASVHLMYPTAGLSNIDAFYCEVTGVEAPVWTYFEACGWHRGYLGMQVNSPTERRIIFSVWDSGVEAVDRNKVAAPDRVTLMAKGNGVFTGDFGNEGTGGHSHLVCDWKTGKKQRFLVTARPVDAAHTIYAGYWFQPEAKNWMLISSWNAPKDGGYLHGLYSFSENFGGANGQLRRKALYGNQWIHTADGRWREQTTATFSHDATGKSDRLDRFMGVEDGQFFLSNGGFIPGTTKYGTLFTRPAAGRLPADVNVLIPSAN